MTAAATVKIQVSLTGLGTEITKSDSFTTTTPTAATYNYRVLAVADTAEALDLGDISTVEGVWIRAVDYALSIDTSYSASFSAEILLAAGKSCWFKPSGTVYVKNTTAAQTPAYEFILAGTT